MMKKQKIFSIILFSAIFLANYSLSNALKEFGLEECEKSRACWAFPPDCDSAQNCHGIMRWRFKENKLLVELEAKPIGEAGDAQWMAMGFSDDLQMGNDSILECIFGIGGNGTSNAAFISYNYFTQNIQLRDASKKMIMDKEFFQSDGKLGCNFTINYNNADEPIADEKKLIFKLDGRRQWWHILFAQGPVDRKSATKQFHLLVQKSEQLVHICQNCTDKFVRIEK